MPYSGISVGWGWGEEDAGGGATHQPFVYQTPTPAKNNRIEMNHIHHVMYSMNDGGGIYTLGNMPGTVIRGNHIHDNGHAQTGGDDLYLDAHGRYTARPATSRTRTATRAGSIWTKAADSSRSPATWSTSRRKPMNYNNLAQNRKATCKEHDNFFGSRPDAAKSIAEKAGLEAEYLALLKAPAVP